MVHAWKTSETYYLKRSSIILRTGGTRGSTGNLQILADQLHKPISTRGVDSAHPLLIITTTQIFHLLDPNILDWLDNSGQVT